MKVRGAVALLGVVLIGVLGPLPSAAQDDPGARQEEIADELDALRDKYDEAEAQEADLLAAFELSRQRVRELEEQVAALEAEVVAARAELSAAEEELGAAEARRRKVTRRLGVVRRELAEAQVMIERQAVEAYMGNATSDGLSTLILRADTFEKAALTSSYARAVAEQQRDVIDLKRALEDDLAALGREVRRSEETARDLRDRVALQTLAVERSLGEQSAARQAALAEAGRQEELLGQVRARKGDYEQRIATLQQESDSIAALLRSRQGGQAIAPSGSGVLALPIPSAPITSGFGLRVHPIFHTSRMHAGVDFSSPSGTPIRAAADGEVVWAGDRGGYGLATVIDHRGALATLYGHQSRLFVSPGDTVARGQVIGAVGSTGFSTGPHLHFEVRVNGNPVNPMAYL